MKKHITDEKKVSGTHFTAIIACLTLHYPPKKPIGIWGRKHLRYLKEHKRLVYLNLLTSGRLNEYLVSVDEQAEDMFSRLVKE